MEEDIFTREFLNCGEIQLLIDALEDNCPDKKTKEYLVWKDKFNYLAKKYNEFSKFKAYKQIQ